MSHEEQERFSRFLSLLLTLEGGVVHDSEDKGGLTALGVTQNTYSDWLHKQGLPDKSVRKITHDEVEDIYYEQYFNKVSYVEDEFCHYLLFDLAVNSGPGRVRDCVQAVSNPHDPSAVLQWRRQYFNRIVANNPTQQKFLKGWLNRLKRIQKYYEVT